MEILHLGSLHIGTRVKITCPICGTIVRLIQHEPDTDIEVELNGMTGEWQAKHVIYTCPVCETRVVSNKYDKRLLSIEVEHDVRLTQNEVSMIRHPELSDE